MRWSGVCRKLLFTVLCLTVFEFLIFGVETRDPPSCETAFATPRNTSDSPPSASAEDPAFQSNNYDNLLYGIPGPADTIIERKGYALGFYLQHKQAGWVSYKLTRWEVTTRIAKRNDRFKADPEAAGGSAKPSDYTKSGYDRGHLAPAADMLFSHQTMIDSFYMSNISPQAPMFNRGVWKKLEAQIRAFAVAEDEIYVVTGPVLPTEKTITIGESEVTVPKYFYKVVYDITPPQKMIAFVLPNEPSKRPLKDFAVTVDHVEKLTGLDFFSPVPEPEQSQMEATITIDAWAW